MADQTENQQGVQPEAPQLLWPHDPANYPMLLEGRRRFKSFEEYRAFARLSFDSVALEWLRVAGLGDMRNVEVPYMEFINGENTGFLADKYHFIETLREMGYTTPVQQLIPASWPVKERIALAQRSGINPNGKIYCKAVDSTDGVGTRVITFSELPDFLKSIKRDYVIQEEVVVSQPEYRYVTALDEKDRTWRIAYERRRPIILGDGIKTIRQLIEELDIPPSAKTITLVRNKKVLKNVPTAGTRLELSKTVNPLQGGYEGLPDDLGKFDNLDRFMLQFISDLEKRVGHKLSLLCFDIGIKDQSVLEEEYDFERMKENVVFFELQIPFDLGGYYRSVPNGKRVRRGFAPIGSRVHRPQQAD